MLRFEHIYHSSKNLYGRLSISLWGSDVLLFHEFINIVFSFV